MLNILAAIFVPGGLLYLLLRGHAAAQGPTVHCLVTLGSPTYLRPGPASPPGGAVYRQGTVVTLLERYGEPLTEAPGQTLVIFRVRIASDGAEGYMYLDQSEANQCPSV